MAKMPTSLGHAASQTAGRDPGILNGLRQKCIIHHMDSHKAGVQGLFNTDV